MKWVLALGIAALVAVTAAAFAGEPPLTGTITLVGTVTEHYRVAQPPISKEAEYISLASQRRKGRPFGYGVLVCTFISVHSSVRECVGTFSLPRGKLTVEGSFLYPTLYELAVTGGTGEYTGTGGVLDVRQFVNHKDSSWYVFDLK